MGETLTARPATARNGVWRAVVATSIGNALEWFDLVVYGFFAVLIARLFFPAGNETVTPAPAPRRSDIDSAPRRNRA